MSNTWEELGWDEARYTRIVRAISDEASKARVAAQVLPVVGPEPATVLAVPHYSLSSEPNPNPPPLQRLVVDSTPSLFLTTISVTVGLRNHELADANLEAALAMFRRAAHCVARVEDALIFGGRAGPSQAPSFGLDGLGPIYRVSGDGAVAGIFDPITDSPDSRNYSQRGAIPGPEYVASAGAAPPANLARGDRVVNVVVSAIQSLEHSGHTGPFGCVLSHDLFGAICTPTPSLVLPRDRILPFLQGPLVRSSAVKPSCGAVLALGGHPLELVIASDISVKFLQITDEPRALFRVSERVALRIKDSSAIAIMTN